MARRYSLTARRVEVLRALHRLTERGLPPSSQDVANAIGLTDRRGVYEHMLALRALGLVTVAPGEGKPKSRTMRLTAAGRRVVGLPPAAGRFLPVTRCADCDRDHVEWVPCA